MRAQVLFSGLVAFLVLAGCGSNGPTQTSAGGTPSTGGQSQSGGGGRPGGTTESGGTTSSGGTTDNQSTVTGGSSSASSSTNAPGGTTYSGGTTTSGGTTAMGGSSASSSSAGYPGGTGGNTATGGTSSRGGTTSTGGNTGSGGQTGTGGAGRGGATGSGGIISTGGRNGTGGVGPTGGSSTAGSSTGGSTSSGATDGGAATFDCNTAMPTSGGQQHSGNSQGGSGNLAWQIWSNAGSGTLTTYSTPAFNAAWNNSGDYLGRMGFEWGNSGKSYDQYGTITAQVSFKKTGSGGGFSYIGIYGWSTNPCIEWYIVDDSFGSMPFNPYNSSQKGTATIDGETYKLFSNPTNGTGGSRCNASSWTQFWSIRQKARQCGTITISDHFKAWAGAGMTLGNLLEAKILVETGGGSGSVDFPVANVAKTQ